LKPVFIQELEHMLQERYRMSLLAIAKAEVGFTF
jgi:hypothetical protein